MAGNGASPSLTGASAKDGLPPRPWENASCEVSDATYLPAMTVEARLID
jgi:hypothetical protein